MYVGRIVAVGMTPDAKVTGMYRVSSRSFPNREAREKDEIVAVMPRPGFEDDLQKNPYIAYHCLRLADTCAIVTNGSHTDPISEKIAAGSSPRDAMALSLLTMDYEKDHLNTPRIAGVVDRVTNQAWLGIVRHDALHVTEFELEPGRVYYVATYEHNVPCRHYADEAFSAKTAAEACQYVISGGVFADLEKPVTAAAAVATEDGFAIAKTNA